ncbi:putative enoyl-CoA hydratase, mitochondrial [Aphelenchoides bicaudatus]|nr:putative enoyl-CoA hydratase, mitochondrial [Aphelenchoides bicaudatus]
MRHYSLKVDERDVPPSRHAIFVRGLDPDVTREQIQKFFEDEVGKNTIAFFKTTRDSVCAAVRFDNRDDATKCMKDFEDKQVLNCNVEITWYKDVRAYADKMERQRNQGRNNFYNNNYKGNNRRSKRSHSPSRDSRSSRRRRSISGGVSISSEEHSPKRKSRRDRSNSSTGRSSSSSSSRSRRSRRSRRSHSRTNNSFKKDPPHTPPHTPPPEQVENSFSASSNRPEFIKVDVVGEGKDIGLITLNRPNSMNAFCGNLLKELADQVTKFDNDSGVGAIVITGDKEYFASGFEVNELLSLDMVQIQHTDFLKNWKRIVEATKPMIASVNGLAIGIGCELALSCDIIYASTGALFGHPEVINGSIPACGGTQLLSRCIGKSLTMEMLLTGARITADEALKRGMVTKVFPGDQLLKETLSMAEKIVKNSQVVNMMAKRAVNYAFNSLLQSGIEYERQIFYSSFATNDRKEGLKALQEKRPAKWTNS